MSHCPGALSGNLPGKEVRSEEEKQCVLCKIELPIFTKEGKHNFCSHVVNGEMKDFCIKCKIQVAMRPPISKF